MIRQQGTGLLRSLRCARSSPPSSRYGSSPIDWYLLTCRQHERSLGWRPDHYTIYRTLQREQKLPPARLGLPPLTQG